MANTSPRYLLLALQAPGLRHVGGHAPGHQTIAQAVAVRGSLEVDSVGVDGFLDVGEQLPEVEYCHSLPALGQHAGGDAAIKPSIGKVAYHGVFLNRERFAMARRG